MERTWLKARWVLVAGAIVLGISAAGQGMAAASPSHSGGNYTCTGTASSPGTLAGTYANVMVTGACVVDAGPVDIKGNLTVAPDATLAALYGLDDQTGTGNSDMTVHGNMVVQQGASVMLGCESLVIPLWGATQILDLPDFPCTDDPNQNAPTLNANEVIDGNLVANDPLGVVVHATTVHGNVVQTGGGAGLGCAAVGIFNQYFGLPDYSDYTDTTVGGNLSITGLDTCWFGALRDNVGGNMIVSNNLSTPDATEIATDTVHGNLVCQNNSPQEELGDSDGQPNKVGGNAIGECGFNVILLNPNDVPGITGTPQPASVHLH
jgi:hypothetical protein